MSRPDISMSDREVEAFLATRSTMVVAAVDAEGWPTGALARAGFADGNLTLQVRADDPIVRDLEREGRLCAIADEHPSYYEIRGVIVHGKPAARGPRRSAGVVEVDVDRIISFDFGRLRASQEGA